MNKNQAYALFEKMILAAKEELFSFTLNNPFVTEEKADKSLVTACDKAIDKKISFLARKAGYPVVSEEGEHTDKTVKSGNYLTIDPIDGTLGYVDYVNFAIKNGGIKIFGKKDLGGLHDFCLLLGIVKGGIPEFGALYNYITNEKILIDGKNKSNLFWENKTRNYTQKFAAYPDHHGHYNLHDVLGKMSSVSLIDQVTVGCKSLYTILNPHKDAVMPHRSQASGLWDILPAAVAIRAFGGEIYDDLGNLLVLNKYAIIPGKGVTVIKGEMFKFVVDILKKKEE